VDRRWHGLVGFAEGRAVERPTAIGVAADRVIRQLHAEHDGVEEASVGAEEVQVVALLPQGEVEVPAEGVTSLSANSTR